MTGTVTDRALARIEDDPTVHLFAPWQLAPHICVDCERPRWLHRQARSSRWWPRRATVLLVVPRVLLVLLMAVLMVTGAGVVVSVGILCWTGWLTARWLLRRALVTLPRGRHAAPARWSRR